MAARTSESAPPGVPEPSYATPAWLRDGKRATAGVLTLHGGRLSFGDDGRMVFDEPAERPAVAFPWYRFGGELRITVGGHRHRIVLTPPHGGHGSALYPTEHVTGHATGHDRATEHGTDEVAAADARRAGRIWRTLLGD